MRKAIGKVLSKTVTSLILLLGTSWCMAATEINKASEAELDGVKGIGPVLSGKILAARQQAPFTSWADLLSRVQGIGPKSAANLSEQGLTVQGRPYQAPAAKQATPPQKPGKGN